MNRIPISLNGKIPTATEIEGSRRNKFAGGGASCIILPGVFSRSDLGRIRLRRLRKTAGIAGLFRGSFD